MTTCARCGAEADRLATLTGGRSGTDPTEFHRFCAACFTRVRVALDWALGGDGGFDAAYIERLESVCCALEFDRGTQEWLRQHPLDNFNIPPANYTFWTIARSDILAKNPFPQSQRFNRRGNRP